MVEKHDLGRIERVGLRVVWPHEANDFTPWLAKNIDLLNENLPFDIDPDSIEQEASAGGFSVDIVGDSATDQGESGKVVIENQLEQTDHDHLGKLLTYLAAYQANAVIWIAGKARPEHAKAVQWLNDNANLDAYLFQVEAIKIDNSRPAAMFTQIVGPSDLSQQVKAARQRDSVRAEQLREYWGLLLPAVEESCRSLNHWQNRTPPTDAWSSAKVTGATDTYWIIRTKKNESSVDLYVDGPSARANRKYIQEFDERLPEKLLLKEDHKPGRRVAKLTRDFDAGWNSEENSQQGTARELADFMAHLVKATLDIVPDLPPYADEVTPKRPSETAPH